MLASVVRLANHWIGLLPESDIKGVAKTIIAVIETINSNNILFMSSLLKLDKLLFFLNHYFLVPVALVYAFPIIVLISLSSTL
jgi:hypothetical protein